MLQHTVWHSRLLAILRRWVLPIVVEDAVSLVGVARVVRALLLPFPPTSQRYYNPTGKTKWDQEGSLRVRIQRSDSAQTDTVSPWRGAVRHEQRSKMCH